MQTRLTNKLGSDHNIELKDINSCNTCWYIITLPRLEFSMARNTSVTIGDHLTSFISNQVQIGRYRSASDVVRAGLRLLEERETQIAALQNALIEGEQSGDPRPFDFEDFKAQKRAKLQNQ